MNVFDIIGPIMIGPSSSHTAGAARIGRTAYLLLGEAVAKAHIILHGSFASTYKGHGTDKALAAGILGMEPWDPGIRTSLQLAEEKGVDITFETKELDESHPNTALINLVGISGKCISVQGASVGGGNIRITHINGMEVSVTGQRHTLIVFHRDVPGAIANVTAILAEERANICQFGLNRKEQGGEAIMTMETDTDFDPSLKEKIQRLPYVMQVITM